MSAPFVVTLPLRTVSPTNEREHWAKKHRRAKAERQAAWSAWLQMGKPRVGPEGRASVTLTRIGPRLLDDDNLPGATKHLRDTLAALLILGEMPGRGRMGHYDDDPRLAWDYYQERGAYAVRVEIEMGLSVVQENPVSTTRGQSGRGDGR